MVLRLYCFAAILFLLGNSSVAVAQNCGDVSLADISNPGPYGYLTMDQNDGLRDGPDYGDATVYYPTTTTAPFACIAIATGFFSDQSSVAAWGPFLASHGIVAIIFDTNSLFDFPEARANALLDALETLRHENTRSDSPLRGLIDENRFGVIGWSMGGGGAQLAAVLDPSLKAVIALCPWLSSPDSNTLNHSVPVLIFSGEEDPTAPPDVHADVHYDLTPESTDKLLFEVAAGNHAIANDPANAFGDIGKYGLAWLRHYLLDDPCHCPLTLQPSTVTSKTITSVDCPILVPCPIEHRLFNNVVVDGTYKAIQTVTSSCMVPHGGSVTLKAQESILLDAEFTTDLNGVFEVVLGTCE